jgi:hypothetical protein
LTINTPSSDQLWNQNVTVTGTIDDSSDYTVWVNGVMATLNGDGTWTATNVFLPPGGTAVIQARAIPNSDNGGNGTGGSGGGPVTYDNLGNPDPPQDQDAEIQTDKPWRLYVLNDTQHSEEMDHFHEVGTDCYNEGCSATSDSQTTTTLTSTWVDGSGGFGSQSGDDNGQSSGNCIGTSVGMSLDGGQVFWPPSSWPNLLSGQEIDTWLSVVTGPQPCTYSTSETNDVLPVIGSEYCDVSDPLPATYGSGETSSLPYGYWVNSTNEMDGTYTRHAQTTWHLQTGGKSGRQSLWAIGAWASEILYKRALPLYDGLYVPMQGIPSTSITVMRKTLGSDGNLYKMLPANDDCDVTPKVDGKDFYTFGVGATKYTPYITANGANLDNETPEFCVGQGVTFALNGLPGFVDAVGHWNLPGNFVNEPFPYSSSCTSYRRNDNLLAITGQNLTTPCWYVNQPGGTVGVNANLHFSNGQYVSVAADGNFTIYRPTVSSFHNDGNGFEKTTFGLQGTMVWDATIDSTYNGFIGVTQIISCDNGNSDYYTLGLNLLDGNTEIYGEPGSLGVPKRYDPTDPNTQFTMLGDSPWDPFHPMCANMIANFKDYIRFQPDGGIFVTLATVDWHMNGNACLVGPISPDDLPPANPPVDSDAFPLWDSVRPE